MKQKLTILTLAAMTLVLVAACLNRERLHSGVILKNMDTSKSPGENFTEYVNGNWMKMTPIPADKSYHGVWSITNDQVQEDVKAIIENAAKGNPKPDSDEQKIGDYYESSLNMEVRNSIGLTPLKEGFQKIDNIRSLKDLAVYFAYANKIGNAVPFAVGVVPDFKDPKKYMLYTWQGGLGLPDREYYLLEDSKSETLRKKYVSHMEKILTIAGMADPKAKAEEIMKLETSMASKHMKKEDTRDIPASYNKYSLADLKGLMPDFDWKAMLTEAGVKNPDTLVVTQVQYTKDLNAILKNTPLATWKTYFKWTLLNATATSLTSALDQQHFDFYGKTLNGVQEQEPQWRRSVSAVNEALGEVVGKVYVKKHFPPAAKERMLKLVDNLLKAYETSIKELDWMSPETKKQALDKLGKFTPKIGYPDQWRDYSGLKVIKGDFYGNQNRAKVFEYNWNLNKLGKPVDRTEWITTPQTVNAFYNPFLNEIVFPAGILQPPYFDMKAEDAINYGGIGAVIGHEIGHGFDDQGSTFDGDGVMRNWWTDQDKNEFKKRTSALIAQYNDFKVFPDLNVNGQFTLGENIGDLGGLSIALKAYKSSLDGKPSPVLDGFTGEQRVFIGWGQSWLGKSREEDLRKLVATNPHSPEKFRVNGVVRNIPEFYTAFNIKPGDSLYLAPDKRVKIW